MKPSYLIVIPWDPREQGGGVNEVVRNLVHQIVTHAEFEPKLLSLNWYAPSLRHDPDFPITHFRLRLRSAANRLRPMLVYLAALFRELPILWRFLRAQAVGVVNIHYPTAGSLQFAILRALGLYRGRLLLSFHGADLADARATTAIEHVAWKWMLRWCDQVTTCSQALAEELAGSFPNVRSKITVIHNGIDLDQFLADEARGFEPSDLAPGRKYVLSIARFEHKKGLDVLIRAFPMVLTRQPDAHLVLVGRDGPEEESLRGLIRSLDLDDRVSMVRNVPHERINAYLRKASVFVLPSRVEPFGIAILEAAAHHVPVIATQVGGIPEIIRADYSGLLVAPEQPDALADDISRLLRDRDMAREMADRLHDEVRDRFSWKSAYARYVAAARDTLTLSARHA